MKYLLSFLAVTIILTSGFYVFNKQKNASNQTLNVTTPTSQVTSTTNPHVESLKMGGSSYLDSSGKYSFLYPNDYTLDTKDPAHIRIFKRGNEQRPQSEITDGILIVFETIDLKNKTLEEWIDNHINQSVKDGTSVVIQNKKAFSINDLSGFSYEIGGFGSTNYLALTKGTSSSFVLISYLISDPNLKDYKSEFDAILSTFEILK